MKIIESTEYDIDIEVKELDDSKIVVVTYPYYSINRYKLKELQDAVNRRYGNYKFVFIPDNMSVKTMSVKELKILVDEIQGVIDSR